MIMIIAMIMIIYLSIGVTASRINIDTNIIILKTLLILRTEIFNQKKYSACFSYSSYNPHIT